MDYLLIVVIIVWFAVLAAPAEAVEEKEGRLSRRGIFVVICIALAGAVIVWYKRMEMECVSKKRARKGVVTAGWKGRYLSINYLHRPFRYLP